MPISSTRKSTARSSPPPARSSPPPARSSPPPSTQSAPPSASPSMGDSLKHGLFFGIGNSLAHNMIGSMFRSNTPEQKPEFVNSKIDEGEAVVNSDKLHSLSPKQSEFENKSFAESPMKLYELYYKCIEDAERRQATEPSSHELNNECHRILDSKK